jgi:hypothetical protein
VNINFEELHTQFLKGSKTPHGWLYTPANPSKPGADLYVASYQAFSNNALSISLLIRNTFDRDGNATAAAPLVSLAFSHRHKGRYLLSSDPDKVVIPIYLEQAIQLFAMLRGRSPSVHIEIVRPGVPPKYLKGFPSSGAMSRFNLKAFTTDEDDAHYSVDMALAPEHVFQLQAYLIALGKLMHPWMDQRTITELFLSSSMPNEDSVPATAVTRPAQASSGIQVDDSPRAKGPAEQPLDPIRVTKAIFAVGVNKWPKRRRDVIRYIQDTASVETMDQLIRAGNSGDFTEWDRIASLMGD